MNDPRFDRIIQSFAQRRLSRRAALATGKAGTGDSGALAHTNQDAETSATPVPAVDSSAHTSAMLFVQTFQAGAITATEGVEGRYSLTLEGGTGQTVYFTDRPDRIVGTSTTPEFLEGLGFLPDNPPNAALIVETSPGVTDVAVIELFAPMYDPIGQGVTYEVEVLKNWEVSLELGLSEAPTDLAALAPSFGAAHLFIDDCPDMEVACRDPYNGIMLFPSQPMCWNYSICMPCEPFGHEQPDRCATYNYWIKRCKDTFGQCFNQDCFPETSWPYWGSFC